MLYGNGEIKRAGAGAIPKTMAIRRAGADAIRTMVVIRKAGA